MLCYALEAFGGTVCKDSLTAEEFARHSTCHQRQVFTVQIQQNVYLSYISLCSSAQTSYLNTKNHISGPFVFYT